MHTYILFLLFGLSATISYSMNLEEARALHKRERAEWKIQNRERKEWDREKQKIQNRELQIRRAGLQGQKSACIIL